MRHVLISNQTAAADATIEIARVATVATKGLGAAETIPVSILTGSTYEPLLTADGAVEITSTQPQLILNGPGNYKFAKGVTVAAVSLQVTE